MNFKKLSISLVLAAAGIMAANAGNIDANAARQAANNFMKSKMTAQGMLKAPSTTDIKLTHTEASSVEGNAFYVFNIKGGGWVIIAGDDRANQVLAYNTTGSLDMNNLPVNAKNYLNRFKTQIEKVQNFKGEFKTQAPKRVTPVGPLMKSNWGQNIPFDRQCPQQYGSYCPVGCAGLAMAQILNYWEYPKEIDGLEGYYNTAAYSMVPALDATTFDYDNILDQYTILNENNQLAWAESVNDENKAEVAKLCRYASQSCLMGFSATGGGSGTDVLRQYKGFLKMGYTTDAKLVGIEAWATRETWNTWDYTDAEWMDLMTAQLEANHPIPYSSEGADGHAFVVDGVDADGLYHANWGFYGAADGWYAFGAFTPTIQGQTLDLNTGLFMIIDLLPYEGYVSPNAPGEDPGVPGDVNGDDVVNITDVTWMLDILLGNVEVTDDLTPDVNGDGSVTIADLTFIIDQMVASGQL